MRLDPDVCYRALSTRDPRFDGRFFTGVRSTGVYCRPICPARPKRENCIFFVCAAAAQEAGYRACLRCRPEAAPGTPAWSGTSSTVSRALRLIADGALDGGSVESLATRVGVGDRHLRRLFLAHLGATPVAVAQNRRLLFAKQLLADSLLPMTEVAQAAGFASLRRFNEAIRKSYECSPSALRERSRRGGRARRVRGGPGLELELGYRPPLDWDALLAFLALRAIPGVEEVEGGFYRRTLRIAGASGWLEVGRSAQADALLARIHLDGPAPLVRVSERLRGLFDLAADPEVIAETLRGEPALRRSLRRHPGLRAPGAWDGFELSVRAILGQQVSVEAATRLAARLVANFGTPLPAALAEGVPGGRLTSFFPEASALTTARPQRLGVPGTRAGAIRALARAVARGQLRLSPGSDPEQALEALQAVPGIGAWTAQYISMRALREPDAFPSGDLVLRKVLGDGESPLSAKALDERAALWRPWRAYAALHLWSLASAARAQAQAPSSRKRTR